MALITPEMEAAWEARRKAALEEEQNQDTPPAGDPPAEPPVDDPATGNDDDQSLNAGLDDGATGGDTGTGDGSTGGSSEEEPELTPEEKQAKVDEAIAEMDAIADKDRIVPLPDESIIEAAKATDQTDLMALEARLNDLNYLREDMIKTHGMSQAFAMEAERILPGFGNVPVAYYSKEPSATRYRVSLEELDKGMWGLIAAAAAAVIVIIYKIFKWITGGGKKDDDKDAKGTGGTTVEAAEKRVDKKVELIEETSKESVEVINTLKEAENSLAGWNITLKDKNGHDVRITSFQIFYEHFLKDDEVSGPIINRFLMVEDPIIGDMIEHGSYSREIENVIKNIRQGIAAIGEKTRALQTVVKRDIASQHHTVEEIVNQFSLTILSEPVSLSINGEKATLRDLSDRLAAARIEATSKHHNKKYDFDSLFLRVRAEYDKATIAKHYEKTRGLLKPLDEVRYEISRMEKVSENMAWDDNPGSVTSAVGHVIRKVLFGCAKDAEGAAKIIGEINTYGQHTMYFGRELAGMGLALLARLNHELRKNQINPTSEMQEIIGDLTRKKKAMAQRYNEYIASIS